MNPYLAVSRPDLVLAWEYEARVPAVRKLIGRKSSVARVKGAERRQQESAAREARAVVAQAKREARAARWRQRSMLHPKVRAEAHARLPLSCEICGDTLRLAIDHDHDTGEVRGRLCSGCNTGLGVFRERDELFLRAVAYLRKYRKAVA